MSPNATDTTGNYVSSLGVVNGVITVTYSSTAPQRANATITVHMPPAGTVMPLQVSLVIVKSPGFAPTSEIVIEEVA